MPCRGTPAPIFWPLLKRWRLYRGRDLHGFLDNACTDSTPGVHAWLVAHPTVQLHFTPKGASWQDTIEVSLAGDGGDPDVAPAALPCRAKMYDLSRRCRALRSFRESLSV